MYKFIVTSGVKYLYVEDNPALAETYKRILAENDEYPEKYAILDSISSSKITGFYCVETLYWKDEHGREKSANIIDWMSLDEINRTTGKNIQIHDDDKSYYDKSAFAIIIEGGIRVERYYSGEEGTHVTYFQEIRQVSDDVILGEAVFTNTLLVD